MRRIIVLLIILLSIQILHAQTDLVRLDGRIREYRLHVPRNLDTPSPLLIVLHGGGGHSQQVRRFTGFDRIANREGFIVVYPDGIDNAWNDGRVFEHNRTADDVAFIAAMIERLLETQPIDPERIYATGISNGGFMSFRLACELSDRIAGIAPVTATLSEDLAPSCNPEQPVKVLVINGTADPLVPYDGGMVTLPPDNIPRGQVLSTADTMQFWADHNQCDPEPVTVDMPDTSKRDETTAQQTTYATCQQSVQLITIVEGGHTWPGGAQYLPVFLVGRTNRDIDASQVIWAFFAAES